MPDHAWKNDKGWFWIYDRETKHEGNEVTIWLNEGLEKVDRNGVKSFLSRITYDCDERLKYTAQTSYKANGALSGQMHLIEI